jgi:hypothetical protein
VAAADRRAKASFHFCIVQRLRGVVHGRKYRSAQIRFPIDQGTDAAVTIQNWHNYLSTTSGAAATLTGLVFVAVSINLAQILKVTGRTGIAAESLVQLLGAMFIAMAALMPWQPATTLGIVFLLLDLILWLVQTLLRTLYLLSKTGQPLRWAITRIVRTSREKQAAGRVVSIGLDSIL